MKRRYLTPLVAVLALLASVRAAEPARPPNVIIILADDMGYADVGVFGGRPVTPNLDRMAAEGRRFTNFYVSQPICSASRASLLTGSYANRIGITGALMPTANYGLSAAETTIAALLKQRGYATGMAGKWHLGHLPQFLPIHRGFDEYLGLPYSHDMWPPNTGGRVQYASLPLIEGDQPVRIIATPEDQGELTALYTQRAVDFIGRHKDEPFFFYLAHSMPHVPIFASPRFQGKTGLGLYADVIAELDWSVGEVLAALKRHGLDDNTLVIFTSDNGPWLVYGNHAGSAGPLREGKMTSWDGGVRVPCIMRWPGHIPAGTATDAAFMTIDLFPTIARLAGAPLPAHRIDGRDVWPLLAGEPGATNPHAAYLFYNRQDELHAVLTGDGRWKLQLPHTYPTLAGRPGGRDGARAKSETARVEHLELYDVQHDLGETTDVAAAHPEIVRNLLLAVEQAREDMGDALVGRKKSGEAKASPSSNSSP